MWQHQNSVRNQTSIFGAFTCSYWEDTLGYFGNAQNYLFSLDPKLNTFFTYNGKGGKNFCYLNTKNIKNSKYKRGIGLGGNNFESFRIWLDYEILKKSKSSDFGKTYQNGILTDSPDEFLKILGVEIFGFPKQDTKEV